MKLSGQQINSIVNYFRNTRVSAVYLFGSYARGDADADSDIDLIVELDDRRHSLDVRRCKRELKILLSIPVDIYEHTKVLKYARPHIWQERKLIYKCDYTD